LHNCAKRAPRSKAFALRVLSQTYSSLRRWEEAVKLLVEESELYKVSGDKRELRIGSYSEFESSGQSWFARAYQEQGKYQEAEQAALNYLELSKKLYGEQHKSVILGMAYLASIYFDQKRLTESTKLSRQAIEAGEKFLTRDDETMLPLALLHALSAQTPKERNEGQNIAIRALEGYEKVYGKDHELTLNAMEQVATIYFARGYLDKARALRRERLERTLNAFGDHDRNTAVALIYFAGSLFMSNIWDEAESLATRAVSIGAETADESDLELKGMRDYLRFIQKKRRIRKLVATVIPEPIIIRIARMVETSVAWLRWLRHYLA